MTASIDATIRPISHQSTNDATFRLVEPLLVAGVRVLDLGAGKGYFSQWVGEHVRQAMHVEPATIVAACDVTPEIFRYGAITCNRIGADGRLPYADASFDVVCSLEVVEHVEDQYAFCREILRVLRPGGRAIVSTPNVLNMNSRWRIFGTGFATLFDPLSLSEVDVVHTSGHIHPVSYYYLAFALLRAGASEVSPRYDRTKRSAVALWLLSWPLMAWHRWRFRQRLARRQPQVAMENAALLDACESRAMCCARSIIVVARAA
ncbi:MAG: class I SAM-dependent methyltransferase [Gemmatimonadetes bacterium]|nr:class I SAM-dependent methyltransferase [Gemmatimonadota bacterium]